MDLEHRIRTPVGVTRESSSYNIQQQRQNIRRSILAAATISILGIIGSAAALSYYIMKRPLPVDSGKEFDQAYDQALLQYADIDRDGIVTSHEMDDYDRGLLQDKNVNLVFGRRPRYKDGTDVPYEVLTKWIKEYRPNY